MNRIWEIVTSDVHGQFCCVTEQFDFDDKPNGSDQLRNSYANTFISLKHSEQAFQLKWNKNTPLHYTSLIRVTIKLIIIRINFRREFVIYCDKRPSSLKSSFTRLSNFCGLSSFDGKRNFPNWLGPTLSLTIFATFSPSSALALRREIANFLLLFFFNLINLNNFNSNHADVIFSNDLYDSRQIGSAWRHRVHWVFNETEARILT